MRAFNQSQNSSSSSTGTRRDKPSCSYCNDPEHQVTSCPHVKSDWAMFQSYNIPCSDPNNWTNNPIPNQQGQRSWGTQQTQAHWFKDPSGWSKWYAQCEKAFDKIKAKELRDAQKSKAKSKGKKAKSCGFCGGTGHNRRDCSEMTALNNRLIRANNHWRQRLYDTFVLEMGLGAGALIKVTEQSGHWNNRTTEEHVAIATSINWNELNMFCHIDRINSNWRNRVHENLQAPIEIKVQVNGRERTLTFPTIGGQNYPVVNDVLGRPLIDTFGYNYNSVTFKSVMSPTETPLSEDWLTQGQAECVEFITKRYSYDKLKEWSAIDLLEKYEKRFNLTQQS
jgi:hypothetical protein